MRTTHLIRQAAVPAMLALAHAAWAATPLHAPIRIVCGRPEASAGIATRAYAAALRSVAYAVVWVSPAETSGAGATVLVVPLAEASGLSAAQCARLVAFVERGGKIVTAGDSPLSRALGVRFGGPPVRLAGITDSSALAVAIRWRTAARLTPFVAPEPARTFSWSTGTHRPVVVAFAHGHGTVLFLGVELDEENPLGSSRFPFFVQEVGEAFGIAPALSSSTLATYADPGDHRGEDPTTLARAWRRRGIREIHLGAWEAFDADGAVYAEVITACHRTGIRVYAWLELPEVSTPFWDAHPAWREKTATGQDAHVDWRSLMALNLPECFEAVAEGVRRLVDRFDWDGVDLAEVYFESPQGPDAPELFTPMNRVVREAFSHLHGFDPQELFDVSSARYWKKNPDALAAFLDYRRDLVVELHERLLGVLAAAKRGKPHLEIVLTLVDALYDRQMRDFIGIDAPRITALGARFPFTLQVEDPFTLWTLGPERYAKIAADYAGLLRPAQPFSVDINVVPRGGEVFPTAKQTGGELYQLVSQARGHFSRVCLYSEATIDVVDQTMVPHALAVGARLDSRSPDEAEIESDAGVEIDLPEGWRALRMDSRPWPAAHGATVLVPAGRHLLTWTGGTPGGRHAVLPLCDINAELLGAPTDAETLGVHYRATARAYVTFAFRPERALLDGRPLPLTVLPSDDGFVVVAPPGEHWLRVRVAGGRSLE